MKKITTFFMALFVMLASIPASSQQKYVTTAADKACAARIMEAMQEADRSAAEPLGVRDLMLLAGERMLGTGYVAGTLDDDPVREDLRIYLTKTDCILFVETCLALARTVAACRADVPSFDSFAMQVASTRYRCRPPYRYSDRIHYTTEWIRRQEGRLKDLTLDLGGEVYDHPIDFMTKHYKSYKQLADAANIPRAALDLKRIGEIEDELNKEPMTFIPKDKVDAAAWGIESGDIICFVSAVEGLDIAHVAMAYVKGGRVGFMHASQKDGKVEIDRQTIEEYVSSRSNLSGIKVVRPL